MWVAALLSLSSSWQTKLFHHLNLSKNVRHIQPLLFKLLLIVQEDQIVHRTYFLLLSIDVQETKTDY